MSIDSGIYSIVAKADDVKKEEAAVEKRVIELPTKGKFRKLWEKMGVEWSPPISGDPVSATANLPEGWRANIFPNSFVKIEIIDANGDPQAHIKMNTLSDFPGALVTIFDEEEAKKLGKIYRAEQESRTSRRLLFGLSEPEFEIQEKYQELLRDYHRVVKSSKNCGTIAQPEIDLSRDKLKVFATEHPQFADQVPERHIAEDDDEGEYDFCE